MNSNSTQVQLSEHPPTIAKQMQNCKHSFSFFRKFFAIAILFSLLLPAIKIEAQAPVITSNTGMPSGSVECKGVAYGNSVYVCILAGGIIYKSADGEIWTKVTGSIPAGTFNKITFGNGVFVVVGNAGLILTSPDGTTWTTRASNTTEYLNDVQYLQSAFYIVGNNGTIRSSATGVTWSTVTLNAGMVADNLQCITYGNSKFVIGIGFSTAANSGAILRSSTGASNSWTFLGIYPGSYINKVQYIKDRFYVFFSGSYIYTSTDATTWTNASITLTLPNSATETWDATHQISSGFYDGTKFFFFGQGPYYGPGSVYTSTNGTSLTLLTLSVYIYCHGSAYLNGKYFQYGNEGIVSSTDGITYKYPSASYSGFASSGTSYVGVGAIGKGLIFSSPDFSTWTSRAPIGLPALNAVTYTGTKYLAIGDKVVVESTNNGVSWTQIATPADNYNAVAYGGGKYVAGGYKPSDYSGKIAYSPDGITWTTANTTDNYYFKVKYVNGAFFALGYSNATYLGVIMYSTNGIAWTNITPTLSYDAAYFNDVVYDGTKYHFMGMEFADAANYVYDDFFSVSTATVTNANSFSNKGTITSPPAGVQLGGTYGEGGFAYSNGYFVGMVNDIASNDSYVIYSQDGVSWTNVAVGEKSFIYSAIAQGYTFRFLGTGDGKITVTFAGGVLPVSLLNFKGVLNNSTTRLSWQTSSEQNTQSFTIEHSSKQGQWSAIGNVAAAGNSNTILTYGFTHSTPVKGVNYYRLLQKDTDGKSRYSNTISIVLSQASAISIYPNPVTTGIVHLQLQEAGVVSIYNAAGLLVLRKDLAAGIQQLDVRTLSKGAYTLRAGAETTRLIIQ